MNIIQRIQEHRVITFLLLVVVVVMGVSLYALISLSPSSSPHTSTETLESYFQTEVGTTSDEEIASLPDVLSVEETVRGREYTLPSVSTSAPDVVVTQDGVVAFESQFTSNADRVHPRLSPLLAELGTPEQVAYGSLLYGNGVEYYIYASQGITVIGRPFSDEVEEVQQYLPMTVSEYIEIWGDDIKSLEPIEDDHI